LDHILKMRVKIQKLNQQCRPGSNQQAARMLVGKTRLMRSDCE
jgi:hypothetical protein